jgi:hypothetical protein
MVKVRESVGDLRIVNARENSDVMNEITSRGLDIDRGMILIMGGQFYCGADAVHALALMGSRSGVFNRLNYWMFRSKTASALIYPVLRWGRNMLLKILGKTKINNLNAQGNDKF